MSRPLFRQVTGGASSLVMYRETSSGVVDPTDPGVVLAIYNEGLGVSQNRQTSSVINGKRGPGRPIDGDPDYQGSLTLAPYAQQTGHILRAICGAPTTTSAAALTLSAAAVTNEGNGFVGLPCANSTFVQDGVVTIVGTTNYNGAYRLEFGTTPNKLVISHAYTAETLTTSAKAWRGRGGFLSGAAVDLGSGTVGLPVAGTGASLSAGDSITVTGTTGYDATYTVLVGSTANLVKVSATYAAETFDGTPTLLPAFYRHDFVLPLGQPTVALQKHFGFEAGAAEKPYSRFLSCKANSFSFDFGGQTEMQFAMDMSVGAAEDAAASLNASLTPVEPAQSAWADRETAIWKDGIRLGDVQSGSVSHAFNIEALAAVGDMGKRYRQTEGDPECTVSFTAFLEEDAYQRLSEAGHVVSVDISMDDAQGDEFWVRLHEALLESVGPQMTGKAGLTQEFTAKGFVSEQTSMVSYTLINRVASYA